MKKDLSFDSEASNSFSDCEAEDVETKTHSYENEKDEEDEYEKDFPNINLIKAISITLETRYIYLRIN